jgi:AcrR family transcriptional regulator
VNKGSAVKRRYQSPLRRAQAQSTRLTIIEAAARLFVTRGYAGTSMDDIATAAGVGRATVFASVGGKAAILKAAYDIAIVGDDDPIPLPQRPWAIAVRNEPDPLRMIDAYAGMITEVSGRVAPIYEAMHGAAGADTEVKALWDRMRTERRGGAAGFVGFLVARHALRAGVDRKRAGDVVWALIDPGMYQLLVNEMAWTPTQFRKWLADTLADQLLQR